jgi:hypothetical protein
LHKICRALQFDALGLTFFVSDVKAEWGLSAGTPVFNPGGRPMAFVTNATINHNKWLVVVDRAAGEEFDGQLGGAPIFGIDDALEYLAHRGD